MVIEKWIIGIVLLCLIDVIATAGLYFAWVKKKTNNKVVPNSFPHNATKRQSILWFVIWAIMIFLNVAIYILISFLFGLKVDPNDNWLYIASFFITAFGYTIVILIIYSIVKSIVKAKLKKE